MQMGSSHGPRHQVVLRGIANGRNPGPCSLPFIGVLNSVITLALTDYCQCHVVHDEANCLGHAAANLLSVRGTTVRRV